MAPSVYHIMAHMASLILDRAGFIERFVPSEPGTIALAVLRRAEWLHPFIGPLAWRMIL